ncbi:hypothetical protein Tco_0060791 [Tanacetum coccineum]
MCDKKNSVLFNDTECIVLSPNFKLTDESKTSMETVPGKDYILLPLWPADLLFSQSSKSSPDAGFKPSSDGEKKVDGDPSKEDESNDQEKDDNVNNTNNVNTASDRNNTNNVNAVSSNVNAADIEVNAVGAKISIELPDDPNMPELEDIVYSDDDEDVGAEVDINNLDAFMPVSLALADLPNGKRAIRTKWVYRNKKDERGIVIKNKASKAEGRWNFYHQDKYVIEILKKFGFTDVKTASTPMETQKPLLKDEDGEEVDVHLYRSMIGSLMYLTSSRPDIMFAVCACARYQVNPKVSHLHDVKRIFRYLKGQPKLGLWYPKDPPFDLVAYTDSDYARASLDRKSTTGGFQFLRIIETRHAEFLENANNGGSSSFRRIELQEARDETPIIHVPIQINTPLDTSNDHLIAQDHPNNVEENEPNPEINVEPKETQQLLHKLQRNRKPTNFDDYYTYLNEADFDLGKCNDPESFEDAITCDQLTRWRETIEDEMNSMSKNNI